MEIKRVCVLGLGYIGLPTASLLANSGFEVVGVDNTDVLFPNPQRCCQFRQINLRRIFPACGFPRTGIMLMAGHGSDPVVKDNCHNRGAAVDHVG